MSGRNFDDLAEDFEFIDDWEDRYRYVIDLGKSLAPFKEEWRTPAYKVEGCVSQVWLKPAVETAADGTVRLSFTGDSDALIVRGLIAILQIMLSGRTVEEIAAEDVAGKLARLGLDEHLTPQRSNGLKAMVQRIKQLAGEARTAPAG